MVEAWQAAVPDPDGSLRPQSPDAASCRGQVALFPAWEAESPKRKPTLSFGHRVHLDGTQGTVAQSEVPQRKRVLWGGQERRAR